MRWGIVALGAVGVLLGCGRVVQVDDYGEPAASGGGSGGIGSWTGEAGSGDGQAGTGGFDEGVCPGDRAPRAETCASTEDEDCDGVDCVVWGEGFQVISPLARVKADAQGNLYVFGASVSTADFGHGALGAEGGSDLLLAKYDAQGKPLWSRRFGDAEDQLATALALDTSGNVLLGGSFRGVLDFGGGVVLVSSSLQDEDAFVAKLDGSGSALWAKRLGDAGAHQSVNALGATQNGDVIVAGDFAGTLDLGGQPLTAAGKSPARDVFLGRLDASDGAHQWSLRLGDEGWQSGIDLGVDAWDGITLTGTLTGMVEFGETTLTADGTDIYVARFEENGRATCASLFSTGEGDSPLALGVDPAGDVFVAGYYSGTLALGGTLLSSEGAQDVFLTKQDPLCQAIWSRSFGSEGNEYAADLAVTAAGEVYLTLSAQGSVDMGGGLQTGRGNADVVLAKYDAGGSPLWSRLFGDVYQQDFPHVATAGVTAVLAFSNTGVVDLGHGPIGNGLVLAGFAP